MDCTEDKEMCGDYEVTSFPTLLFGEPMSPDRYSGQRGIEDLRLFAKSNLAPYCSIYNMDSCSEKEKKAIEELKKKPLSELMEEDERVDKILEEAQEKYDEALEEMNQKYDEMVTEYNAKMDEIRADTNYRYIQQIIFEHNEDAKEESTTKAEL